MSIAVKDFVPEWKKEGIFKKVTIEEFDETMKKINEWVARENPTIIQIETVVLPNIHDSDEHGSQDTDLYTGGETSSHWYQLIRVWYNP